MTTQFKDLADLMHPLLLPIGGKTYQIAPLSFEDATRVHGILDGTEKPSDEDFYRLLLGDTFDQMLADRLPIHAITRAAQTALTDLQYGRELAAVMWATGGDRDKVEAAREAAKRGK